MKLHMNTDRIIGRRDIMIYGHFIEHFHRQIYGGIYDPGNSLSDESGLRSDVLEAMRKIRVPFCAGQEAALFPPITGRTR